MAGALSAPGSDADGASRASPRPSTAGLEAGGTRGSPSGSPTTTASRMPDGLPSLEMPSLFSEEPEPPKKLTRSERRKARHRERRDARHGVRLELRDTRHGSRLEFERRLEAYNAKVADHAAHQEDWDAKETKFREEMMKLQEEQRLYEEAIAEQKREREEEDQRQPEMTAGANPWTALLYIPSLRDPPCPDMRRVRIRLFLQKVEQMVVDEAYLERVIEIFKKHATTDGVDFFLSEDRFRAAMEGDFYSELRESDSVQLFWRLRGEMGLKGSDGFLPITQNMSPCLARTLCTILNGGNKLARALGAFERMCSEQELMKKRMKRKGKKGPKGKKGAALDFDVPENATQEGLESVVRGDHIGGADDAPHPNRALFAAALTELDNKGVDPDRLPWKLPEGKQTGRILPIGDFIGALRGPPVEPGLPPGQPPLGLFTLFFGALLDAYFVKECTWEAELSPNADTALGTSMPLSPAEGMSPGPDEFNLTGLSDAF